MKPEVMALESNIKGADSLQLRRGVKWHLSIIAHYDKRSL